MTMLNVLRWVVAACWMMSVPALATAQAVGPALGNTNNEPGETAAEAEAAGRVEMKEEGMKEELGGGAGEPGEAAAREAAKLEAAHETFLNEVWSLP